MGATIKLTREEFDAIDRISKPSAYQSLLFSVLKREELLVSSRGRNFWKDLVNISVEK